ncbi:zinc-ribbon domain-containing protein [Glacieibacterium frigidum]|uniref:Zinc finger/thioredoxin putative domain-containing protein n=1 Tax=Glacieibacterium frigidum TaxID=2593303 RepID=A0A552UH76_9SPHN|nr:zinc-ribbon domain-containing protein [Glacieibacterium frigidum]TRW17572.1 hypothetical protein FMM06_05325 [Glacieibacterium frigidum]
MIVSCPECGARYRLADDAIPVEGRAMRCAACKHRWYEMGPDPVAAAPSEPVPEPAAEPVLTPEQAAWSPDPEPDDEPAPERHVVLKTVVALLLSAAFTAGAALLWVPDLPPLDLSRVPWLERVVAPPAKPKSPLGIVFEVEPQPVADGRTLFVVRGAVINPTRAPQPIPRLEGRLVDPSSKIIYRWTVDPGRTSLPPGGRAPFDTSAIGESTERAVVRVAD